ncbi:MAG: rhodanese-like domain-containing protein, partial [Chloroflexi bacterium]|nr:rhodanese-like domain-containing protein [Chloroflexota bacterium]
LEHIGHKKICILDGGFDKWLELGLKAVNEETEVQPVEYKLSEPDLGCLVDTDWVITNLAGPEIKMVFSLPLSNYYGQQVPGPKEGHIPGSVCIPVARHFNPDSTWKSAKELRKLYQDFGVTADKMVVSYCLNGAAAATNFFALKHILGYPRASVYLASISGWCNDPRNLPLETYGNPRLLKEPEWVFYWGLKARPMMYDTYVRVVDARSNSEYEEGHIPYSINLPALDTLFCTDKAITRVHEIKSILGNIGVSADCKVVIYDNNNGLQAAWLFWVLEYLGHKDVSILNGGFDRWKATGRKISNEPTPIAKAKPGNVFDISIHKTIFKAATQTHKLATRDWINGQTNNTDKLFLTSSSSTGTIEKVIPDVKNISWLNNVNEQGTFKTAAQLASIYFDSGISPFKEIVCYSDTPMEAAHSYFTLRLLGYPKVRLCPGL